MPNRIIQYPVPLMLKKILKDKSSGELIVAGKNFSKILFFSRGDLIYAKTNVIEERLGEILFKIGKINRDQFMGVNELKTTRDERIGKIMVQEQILNQRDLFFSLIYQMRAIATSTFSLVSGEWNFINKPPAIPDDSRFKIRLAGIITEGTNKLASLSYFRDKYDNKAPNAGPIADYIKEFLSGFEFSFYKELTQFNNLANSQIIAKMNVPEDTYWKKVVLFYLLNIVEFVDVTVDKELDKNLQEILKLYEQMQSGRSDYYQILGVQPTANYNEIKNAYFNYAKKYHPDRLSFAPDPEIQEKANFVFAEINKAYETLSNADKRNAYDSKGYKEDNQVETSQEKQMERARLLHRKAKSLYTLKKYWEATSLLDEAVKLDPNKASYFLLLGMCQMNLPQLRRMAAGNLQKAIDLEHWNVEAFNAMGFLFMAENQPQRAENYFMKVLSINPDHAVARKKLDEITGKNGKKKGKFSIFGKKK
jgi:tetratricopeptide (TPR) repeat protein